MFLPGSTAAGFISIVRTFGAEKQQKKSLKHWINCGRQDITEAKV